MFDSMVYILIFVAFIYGAAVLFLICLASYSLRRYFLLKELIASYHQSKQADKQEQAFNNFVHSCNFFLNIQHIKDEEVAELFLLKFSEAWSVFSQQHNFQSTDFHIGFNIFDTSISKKLTQELVHGGFALFNSGDYTE
ncbi:unnamed protein product [marine sediment metagenome]|uniref:Uncharacterized protein n=1 Tax=marine sediment metagenome TaxID=412755 RepID=X0ZVK0_9ZZZZ